jgi:acylphosphatase
MHEAGLARGVARALRERGLQSSRSGWRCGRWPASSSGAARHLAAELPGRRLRLPIRRVASATCARGAASSSSRRSSPRLPGCGSDTLPSPTRRSRSSCWRRSGEAGSRPARAWRAIEVRGVVQGVGFRPFVWRLATELGLDGTVVNRAGQVDIEVAGSAEAVERSRDAFGRTHRRAPGSRMSWSARRTGRSRPGSGFTIEESEAVASTERLFPPDIATCDDCLRELFDPADRRYRYPFTNCTNCGPRATIIDDLPYDRARTSMRVVPAVRRVRGRVPRPANRRFHAEPVACPDCGPQLSYRRPGDAAPAAHREEALAAALADLRAGRIVAVKGLGGYHLACDATDPAAVARLRDRKHRWAKPFAVMVGTWPRPAPRPSCRPRRRSC